MPLIGAPLLVASGAVIFSQNFTLRGDFEQAFCRFGICSTEDVLKKANTEVLDPQLGNAAVSDFGEALKRDVEFPHRWCDLGDSLLASGDVSRAAFCYRQAVQRGPNSPPILIRAANFCLLTNNVVQGFEYMSRILKLVPNYDTAIFSSWERLNVPLNVILQHGLPLDRRATQSYFEFTLASARSSDASVLWHWLVSNQFQNDRLAENYVRFLVDHEKYDDALATWKKQLGGRIGPYPDPEFNLLYNGSFEEETGATPFNFDIGDPSNHVTTQRDQTQASEGKWSLRINFDGAENLSYCGVRQSALVFSGAYRFRAHVKTSAITTDQGIAFRIFDPKAPARLDQTTGAVTGTMEWIEIGKDFIVPEGTRIIEICVYRKPSLKFDNRLSGTVWVDGITLTRLSQSARTKAGSG